MREAGCKTQSVLNLYKNVNGYLLQGGIPVEAAVSRLTTRGNEVEPFQGHSLEQACRLW